MGSYADKFWQKRAISNNMSEHVNNGDATPEEYASRFNATRDLFEQVHEEEMNSPEVEQRGKR